MSAGFTAFGVYTMRGPKQVSSFFHGLGRRLFGAKVADTVYTEANLRFGAIAFVIMGPVFIVMSVVRLVGMLVG